jgi:hypothetical protein
MQAGVSPLPLLVSTLFWTWLWGPVGLVLAVPMTVCVAVLARHVSNLAFLDVLLSSHPKLNDAVRFQQRTLSLDFEQAIEIALSHCREHGVVATLDSIVLPAAIQVIHDDAAGLLNDDRVEDIRDGLESVVVALDECLPSPKADREDLVLCIPGNDEDDGLAGLMLDRALQTNGLRCHWLSADVEPDELRAAIDEFRPHAICISVWQPAAVRAARVRCQQILKHDERQLIVVAVWVAQGRARLARRFPPNHNMHLVTNITDAVESLTHNATKGATARQPVEPDVSHV